MQLTKRNIDWIGFVATIAVAAGLGYPLLHGQVLGLRALSAEQGELAAKMGQSTEVMDAVQSGQERLALLKQQNSALRSRLPETLQFQSFYGRLTELAGKYGVTLNEVQPGSSTADIYYVMMPVTITAESSFPDFHAFLTELMDEGQTVKVTHLDIHAGQDPKKCTMGLALLLYGAAAPGAK